MFSSQSFVLYTFLIQVASTLAMTGVIWMVQLVHYPLMEWVSRPEFTEYSQRHTNYITYLVGPLMLAEAATATLWLYTAKRMGLSDTYAWTGIALVLIVWGATALLSVPCHDILTRGYDQAALDKLVSTNWIRTVAWTARSVLLCLALKQVIKF